MRVEEARADYLATLVDQQGWTVMSIEEVADMNPRVDKARIPDDLPVSFVPMPAVGAADGTIHVEETRPAGEVKKGFTAFLEGDVLFAKITPCMENGKMAVVPALVNGYGFGSTEFHVLRPKPGMDAKYLYYYVSSQSFRREAERHMTGAVGQRRVPTTYLKECKIPVAPLDQQKRIVAEIEKQFSRLDEAVANLKRVKANLKRYKAAVLKAAVEGRLVETEAEIARREGRSFEAGAQLLQRILETRRSQWQGKGRYKEPAAPDTTDLPELPEGWVWATLDQIGQEGRPIIYGIIKPGPHDPNGVPYVRVTEMKDGFVDLENLRRAVPERAAKFARATLAPGDVLISKDGTIGRVAVVPPQLAGGNITQHVMRAPIHELMCRDYVVSAIRSDVCQKWLTGETKGVALRGVNVEDFRRLPIPVPPYIEQERVLAEVDRRLSLLSETEAQVDANLQRADRLREAILQRAFSSSSSHRTSIHTKLMGDDERLGT